MRKFIHNLNVVLFSMICYLSTYTVLHAQESPDLILNEEDFARLRSGETVEKKVSSDQSGAAVGISIFIQAPVEDVWQTIISCEQANAFLYGLRICEVLEEHGDYAVTHQIVDKGWLTPRLDYTFETRRILHQHMQFDLLSGNLRVLRGSWDFQAFDEGVLVTHMLELRPRFPSPRWLVRRSIKKSFPGMMRCIRALAGGSGSDKAKKEDLNACPGKKP